MLNDVGGRVQVVGKRREFRGDGVSVLDKGRNVGLKTQAARSTLITMWIRQRAAPCQKRFPAKSYKLSFGLCCSKERLKEGPWPVSAIVYVSGL